MMEPPGAPGEAIIAIPSVMTKGTTVARLIGIWFIRHTAVRAGGDGNHRASHVDVGAQRNDKVADFFGNTVRFRALQVDRDGGGRGLGAECGGIAGDLVSDQGEGVFVADSTGDGKLHHNADQVHNDDNEEYLP